MLGGRQGAMGRFLSRAMGSDLLCGTSSGFRVEKGLRRLAGMTTGRGRRRRMVQLSRQQTAVAVREEAVGGSVGKRVGQTKELLMTGGRTGLTPRTWVSASTRPAAPFFWKWDTWPDLAGVSSGIEGRERCQGPTSRPRSRDVTRDVQASPCPSVAQVSSRSPWALSQHAQSPVPWARSPHGQSGCSQTWLTSLYI